MAVTEDNIKFSLIELRKKHLNEILLDLSRKKSEIEERKIVLFKEIDELEESKIKKIKKLERAYKNIERYKSLIFKDEEEDLTILDKIKSPLLYINFRLSLKNNPRLADLFRKSRNESLKKKMEKSYLFRGPGTSATIQALDKLIMFIENNIEETRSDYELQVNYKKKEISDLKEFYQDERKKLFKEKASILVNLLETLPFKSERLPGIAINNTIELQEIIQNEQELPLKITDPIDELDLAINSSISETNEGLKINKDNLIPLTKENVLNRLADLATKENAYRRLYWIFREALGEEDQQIIFNSFKRDEQ